MADGTCFCCGLPLPVGDPCYAVDSSQRTSQTPIVCLKCAGKAARQPRRKSGLREVKWVQSSFA